MKRTRQHGGLLISLAMRSLHSLLIVIAVALTACATGTTEQEVTPYTELETSQRTALSASQRHLYRIGVGDALHIRVMLRSDLTPLMDLSGVRVSESGTVFVPMAGEVQASGLTEAELRDGVRQALSADLKEPVVSVAVTEAQYKRVFLLGEVGSPGAYALDADITVLELIAIGGGHNDDADMSQIALFRAEPAGAGNAGAMSASLDLQALLERAEFQQNVTLQPGDIVYVPNDAIANSNRYFNHLQNVVQPFASIISAIGNVIFINDRNRR